MLMMVLSGLAVVAALYYMSVMEAAEPKHHNNAVYAA